MATTPRVRAGNRRQAVAAGLAVLALMATQHGCRQRETSGPAAARQAVSAPCRALAFEGDDYIVCELAFTTYSVSLTETGAEPGGDNTISDFFAARVAAGRPPVLVMNAGMYRPDLTPVGLLVEGGVERSPLELGDGQGNFYLKPNGVFYIADDGSPHIRESEAYAEENPAVWSATQSGPILLSRGALHAALEENGRSRFVRNAVGVRDSGTVVLVASRRPVSFGSLARLFRDALGCNDALYLDGVVSAISGPDGPMLDGTFPAGPVLLVEPRLDQPTR